MLTCIAVLWRSNMRRSECICHVTGTPFTAINGVIDARISKTSPLLDYSIFVMLFIDAYLH